MIKLNLAPDLRILRQFAWTAAIALPLITALFTRGDARWFHVWAWHWTSTPVLILAGIGVGQLLSCLAGIRQPTRWLYVVLMLVAVPIGFVLSQVLMAAIFYLLFTPIGLFFRLTGRDAMGRKFDPAKKSYWHDRGPARSPASYFKLY